MGKSELDRKSEVGQTIESSQLTAASATRFKAYSLNCPPVSHIISSMNQ